MENWTTAPISVTSQLSVRIYGFSRWFQDPAVKGCAPAFVGFLQVRARFSGLWTAPGLL